MNTLDIILSIPLFLGLLNGYRRGFFLQIAGIIAIVILFVFGSVIAEFIQNFLLTNQVVAKDWVHVIGYILTAVLVFLLLGLTARILKKIIKTIGLGFFEKLAGAIFGVVKVILILILIYLFFEPVNQKFNIIPLETVEGSLILDYVEIGKNIIQDFKILNIN